MAFEKRKGNPYYYRKKRIGGRVASEYVGTGEFAELRSELDSLAREINRNLVDALFLINGYRQHKRQWRRKRNEGNDETERQ